MIGGKHEFHDIANELYRVYEFPGPDGKTIQVRIDKPTKLAVSERHGHRIIDQAGKAHYVPPGWIHLWWEVVKGTNPFVA